MMETAEYRFRNDLSCLGYCFSSDRLSAISANPVWTINQFSDQSIDPQSNTPPWKEPEYYSTIHFADINGDGAADVCGRGPAGFYCGLAPADQLHTTWSFVGAQSVAAPDFSDQNGWNAEWHYKCLWLIENWDGQKHTAICGRVTMVYTVPNRPVRRAASQQRSVPALAQRSSTSTASVI